MDYIQYLNIYDVSSMLYAGELSKAASGSLNFLGESKTVSGVPIAGVRNVLRNYMHDAFQHTAVLLAFDSKTDKNKLFKDYKSTRESMPKIYVQQMMLLDVVQKLGIPYMKADTYEADDLIHAAVLKYAPKVAYMSIYSGDTDLAANIINDHIALRGTASIYPTFDAATYTHNIKKGCVIPYNSILPYYMFFGKASNNVPAFSDAKTNNALFKDFLDYCTAQKIPEAQWSESCTLAQWLVDCMNRGKLSETDVSKIYSRIGYIYPKDYSAEIPESFKYVEDFNQEDLVFFLKLFNVTTALQTIGMEDMLITPKTAEMYNYIDKYKTIYQDGCLAVDNDMTPDDSFFSSSEETNELTDVFDLEGF